MNFFKKHFYFLLSAERLIDVWIIQKIFHRSCDKLAEKEDFMPPFWISLFKDPVIKRAEG